MAFRRRRRRSYRRSFKRRGYPRRRSVRGIRIGYRL